MATLRPGNPTIPEFETMSGKHLGSGLVLCEPPIKKTKHVPLNSGKSYLKWRPFTTILLLRECRDKEVWAVAYGKKLQLWQDIALVLKSMPNMAEELSSLGGDKCKEEFERNVKVYRADSNGAPWRSGSDEEFTEWHQLMEDIIQVMDGENVGNVQEYDDTSHQFDFVSPCASDKQATECDV